MDFPTFTSTLFSTAPADPIVTASADNPAQAIAPAAAPGSSWWDGAGSFLQGVLPIAADVYKTSVQGQIIRNNPGIITGQPAMVPTVGTGARVPPAAGSAAAGGQAMDKAWYQSPVALIGGGLALLLGLVLLMRRR